MRFLLVVLVLVSTATGCGDSKVAPVSGRITFKGQPLPDASVTFQPISTATSREPGSGSYGRTDAAGRFALRLVENDRPGALIGKHAVSVTTGRSEGAGDKTRIQGEKVSPQFRNGSQQYEVPVGGTDGADFEVGGK